MLEKEKSQQGRSVFKTLIMLTIVLSFFTSAFLAYRGVKISDGHIPGVGTFVEVLDKNDIRKILGKDILTKKEDQGNVISNADDYNLMRSRLEQNTSTITENSAQALHRIKILKLMFVHQNLTNSMNTGSIFRDSNSVIIQSIGDQNQYYDDMLQLRPAISDSLILAMIDELSVSKSKPVVFEFKNAKFLSDVLNSIFVIRPKGSKVKNKSIQTLYDAVVKCDYILARNKAKLIDGVSLELMEALENKALAQLVLVKMENEISSLLLQQAPDNEEQNGKQNQFIVATTNPKQ